MIPHRVQPCTPADLWHHRLNQVAHRAASLGWLLLPVLWLPAKVPVSVAAAVVVYAAIIAVACSFCSTLLVRPDDHDLREAAGAFAFSLTLLVAGWIIAATLHLQVKALLAAWLRLDFDPDWLRWALRSAVLLLVVWIAIVTALGRRGRA